MTALHRIIDDDIDVILLDKDVLHKKLTIQTFGHIPNKEMDREGALVRFFIDWVHNCAFFDELFGNSFTDATIASSKTDYFCVHKSSYLYYTTKTVYA